MPKVTILPDARSVDVPAGTSLLDASRRAGAWHGCACGGVGACCTCHVKVRSGFDSLSPPQERELDMLERAFDLSPASRLGCQARVGEQDVVFEITADSLKSWLDENPVERRSIEQGKLPDGASPELRSRLQKYVRSQGAVK